MANEGVFPKSNGDIGYASDFNRINLLNATQRLTNTQDSTVSTSYVDTSTTITLTGLDSAETYDIYAIVSGYTKSNVATGVFKLVIGSTDICEAPQGDSSEIISISGILKGQTGITSITAKLQFKALTGTLIWGDTSNIINSISIVAFPQ